MKMGYDYKQSEPTATATAQNIIVNQFEHDLQLEVMGALAMIRFTGTCDTAEGPSSSSSVASVADKDPHPMLSVLNWIASCFVREPQGDVVATALSTEHDKLTLHIAMNRGIPEAKDRKNAGTFLSALREALTKSNPLDARRTLVYAAFSVSSARVSRKFQMISNMPQLPPTARKPPPDHAGFRFQEFVKRWSDRGGKEGDVMTRYFRAVFKLDPPSPEDALIVALHQLVLFGPQSSAECMENKYAFATLAHGLCRSEFFTTLPPTAPFPPKDDEPFGDLTEQEHAWLMKLKRRIWRLAHYISDADTFVQDGFSYIKRVLGDKCPNAIKGDEPWQAVFVAADPD